MIAIQNPLFPIFSVLLLLTAAAYSAPDKKPNIIYIVSDDLGYGDLGSYGQMHIRTPRLDQMAKEGLRFTDHYAGHTVCRPSRLVLWTGQHVGTTGLIGNRSHSLTGVEATVAQLLKKAGSATCVSGKWHCNAMFNSPAQAQPSDAGFDHWFATQNNASPSHENPKNYVRNGKPVGQLEAENEAMSLLSIPSVRIESPRPIPSVNGEFITHLDDHGQEFPVRLLSYVEGTLMSQVQLDAQGRRSLGRLLGSIDTALSTHAHPATHRDFYWDLQHGPSVVVQYIEAVDNPGQRSLLNYFLDGYETHVAPALSMLRRSVVHHDANDNNVIVRESDGSHEVVGIIDFGDMVEDSVTNGEETVRLSQLLEDRAG